MLGPVMLDLEGLTLSQEEKELILHPGVGGIIFFARNYSQPKQLERLVNEIRTLRSELLLAVDQEGGRVQRFKGGFTEIPPMAELGVAYDEAPTFACDKASSLGFTLARELREFDIDFSFTPVIDLNYGNNAVIGNRSFHRDAKVVRELSRAFCQGMTRAGMATVGKHFPGHGFVSTDSHHELPVDDRDFSTIETSDLIPFYSHANIALTGIMPAHIVYPQVDVLPAGFSKIWLQDILRNKLKFDGVIFSDDLAMAGAAPFGDFPTRAKLAVDAGCDMVLVCNNRQGAIEVLTVLDNTNPELNSQLLKMKAG